MSFFNELVFEQKWDWHVRLLVFFATLALFFEVAQLAVNFDRKYHVTGIFPLHQSKKPAENATN